MLPNGFGDSATRMEGIQPYLKWCHVYGNGERSSFANGFGCYVADTMEIRVFRSGNSFRWGIFCISDSYHPVGEAVVDQYGYATEYELGTISYRKNDMDYHAEIYIENDGEKLISQAFWRGRAEDFFDYYTYFKVD